MNTAEVLKWKCFCRLSLKFIIFTWLISLILYGFSSAIIFFGLKASSVAIVSAFFWVFCARDENG
jgi:hypothetical protein